MPASGFALALGAGASQLIFGVLTNVELVSAWGAEGSGSFRVDVLFLRLKNKFAVI